MKKIVVTLREQRCQSGKKTLPKVIRRLNSYFLRRVFHILKYFCAIMNHTLGHRRDKRKDDQPDPRGNPKRREEELPMDAFSIRGSNKQDVSRYKELMKNSDN